MRSRGMLRFFVPTLALLIALPAAALAQSARVDGMAIQGDYIKDYTGMLAYPGQVSAVGNMVFGELGDLGGLPDTHDRAVGAVIGNLWEGRAGTWAAFLRQEANPIGQADNLQQPNTGFYGDDPNSNQNSSFDLMWGKQFGTMRLGLRLRRAYFEQENTVGGVTTTLKYDPSAATPNEGRNIMGFAGGLTWEMNSSTTADVGLTYESRTFSTESPAPGDVEEDNPTTFMLNGRLFWQWQPNIMLVPVFKWYSMDLSVKPEGAAALEATLKGWQAGAAGNWALGSNDLFVLGLTFAQNKVEQDAGVPGGPGYPPPFYFSSTFAGTPSEITETFTPEVFAALETHVNNWLTLRFGARNGAWHTLKAEDTDPATPSTDTEKIKDSPFLMNLGTGIKVGTLQLDALLNDFFPFTGGYLFSGSTAGPAFLKISATYPF